MRSRKTCSLLEASRHFSWRSPSRQVDIANIFQKHSHEMLFWGGCNLYPSPPGHGYHHAPFSDWVGGARRGAMNCHSTKVGCARGKKRLHYNMVSTDLFLKEDDVFSFTITFFK